MNLTQDQLERLAGLVPLFELYREKYETEDDILEKEVYPFVEKIKNYNCLTVCELNHTYSSCVPLFITDNKLQEGENEGVQLAFSSLLPVAIVGTCKIHSLAGEIAFSPLTLGQLKNAGQLTSNLMRMVKDTLNITSYKIIEPYILTAPQNKLEPVQQPWAAYESDKPWNKLYHLAFQEVI